MLVIFELCTFAAWTLAGKTCVQSVYYFLRSMSGNSKRTARALVDMLSCILLILIGAGCLAAQAQYASHTPATRVIISGTAIAGVVGFIAASANEMMVLYEKSEKDDKK